MARKDLRRCVPDLIREELDACGLPWGAEYGSRHIKILVAGHLAGVIGRGAALSEKDRKSTLKVRAQVRHLIAKLKAAGPTN